MKKKLEIYFNSFKQSVLHKPTALIMLVSMIIVATFVCGLASRMLVSELESRLNGIKEAIVQIENVYDYKAIGEYMLSLQDEVAFADDSNEVSVGYIEMMGNNVNTISENVESEIVSTAITTCIKLEVFDCIHSKEAIQNGENAMTVNREFLVGTGAKVGQVINFMGSDFEIIAENNTITKSSSNVKLPTIYVPYSAELVDLTKVDDSNRDFVTGSSISYVYFTNFERLLKGSETKKLRALGAEVYVSKIIPQTELIILIGFLVGSCLSIISIMNYWQKVNDRKYAVYKTLGAGPAVVAGVMISETFVLASVSVGIGLLIDYLVNLVLNIGYIGSLLWLHYLILFCTTLLSVMIMMCIKVVKRARAVPASKTKFG